MSETVPDPELLVNHLVYLEDLSDYGIQRCKELLGKDLPFEDSKILIRAFSGIFESVKRKIINLIRNIKEYEVSDLLAKINLNGKGLATLHDLFKFFEPLGRENISQSNVYLLEYITKMLDRDKNRFIFVPSYEFNFGIIEILGHLKSVITEELPFSEIKERGIEKIFLIDFPFVYRDNLVTNSMVAHEIGHFIYQSNDLDENYKKQYNKNSDKINEEIEYQISETLKQLFSDIKTNEIKKDTIEGFLYSQEKAQMFSFVSSQIRSYVEELVADMIAFDTFGPVYLISCFQLLSSINSSNGPFGTHPSLKLRIGILLEEYNDKYSRVDNAQLQEIIGEIGNLSDSLNDEYEPNIGSYVNSRNYENSFLWPLKPNSTQIERLTSMIEDVAKDIALQISIEIKKYTTIEKQNPEVLIRDANFLRDVIAANVPPSEIESGVAASIPSILNAGILFKSSELPVKSKSKWSDDNTLSQVSLRVDRLILKAVELSTIQSKMKKDK